MWPTLSLCYNVLDRCSWNPSIYLHFVWCHGGIQTAGTHWNNEMASSWRIESYGSVSLPGPKSSRMSDKNCVPAVDWQPMSPPYIQYVGWRDQYSCQVRSGPKGRWQEGPIHMSERCHVCGKFEWALSLINWKIPTHCWIPADVELQYTAVWVYFAYISKNLPLWGSPFALSRHQSCLMELWTPGKSWSL